MRVDWLIGLFVGALVWFGAGRELQAGPDPDYVFNLSQGLGAAGDSAEVTLSFDILGDALAGWSIGVCHDELVDLQTGDVENGSVTATSNMGGVPQFQGITVLEDGWTVGAIVNLTGGDNLDPGEDLEMYIITYDLLQVGDSVLSFCDDLGDPPVINTVVVGVTGITPTMNDGGITIIETLPPFTFDLPEVSLEYLPEDGLASVTIGASVVEDPESPTFPSGTQGFSMGVGHNSGVLVPTDLDVAGPLLELNGGTGPIFVGVNIEADGGVTVGIVYAFDAQTIEFETPLDVISIAYDAVPGALIDNVVGITTSLAYRNDLGVPPVRNTIAVGGFSQDVILESGTVQLIPRLRDRFIRGDCNDEGIVNIADGIFLLSYLFEKGTAPGCAGACDTNSDGPIQLADAIYLFSYLFQKGPVPGNPSPPNCGTTDIPDEECENQDSCK